MMIHGFYSLMKPLMHWGHGIGAVLISPERQYVPMTARLCFNCTNNIAEYEACVMGIRAAIDFKVKSLKIYGDSCHPSDKRRIGDL